MGKTEPIRSHEDIDRLKQYYLAREEIRNYTMVTLAMNTSLRISDLLKLQWKDVYSFENNSYKKHIRITEQKTGKETVIAINHEAQSALKKLQDTQKRIEGNTYIFKSRVGQNQPIGRIAAFKIIKNAATELGIEGIISCHSLRKTFGYHSWKNGVPPALIMSIYNHSSLEITKRYLGIEQDDKDAVFLMLNL